MQEDNFFRFMMDFYSSFFYIPKAKKEMFLDKVREKVVYYKPRMEDTFHVNLDDISVIDDKCRKCRNTKIILKSFLFLYRNFIGFAMRYDNSSIYVPFYLRNRLSFDERGNRLDQAVVHELSHGFWDKLGGKDFEYDGYKSIKENFKNFRLWRLWNEGFATYCEHIHFLHLYPKDYKIIESDSDLYITGRKKIQKVVKKEGEGVILEIPKRFSELSDLVN